MKSFDEKKKNYITWRIQNEEYLNKSTTTQHLYTYNAQDLR